MRSNSSRPAPLDQRALERPPQRPQQHLAPRRCEQARRPAELRDTQRRGWLSELRRKRAACAPRARAVGSGGGSGRHERRAGAKRPRADARVDTGGEEHVVRGRERERLRRASAHGAAAAAGDARGRGAMHCSGRAGPAAAWARGSAGRRRRSVSRAVSGWRGRGAGRGSHGAVHARGHELPVAHAREVHERRGPAEERGAVGRVRRAQVEAQERAVAQARVEQVLRGVRAQSRAAESARGRARTCSWQSASTSLLVRYVLTWKSLSMSWTTQTRAWAPGRSGVSGADARRRSGYRARGGGRRRRSCSRSARSSAGSSRRRRCGSGRQSAAPRRGRGRRIRTHLIACP
jgi:hypothetical protein